MTDSCRKNRSSETRRNPRLSDLVRLGLWRVCGASANPNRALKIAVDGKRGIRCSHRGQDEPRFCHKWLHIRLSLDYTQAMKTKDGQKKIRVDRRLRDDFPEAAASRKDRGASSSRFYAAVRRRSRDGGAPNDAASMRRKAAHDERGRHVPEAIFLGDSGVAHDAAGNRPRPCPGAWPSQGVRGRDSAGRPPGPGRSRVSSPSVPMTGRTSRFCSRPRWAMSSENSSIDKPVFTVRDVGYSRKRRGGPVAGVGHHPRYDHAVAGGNGQGLRRRRYDNLLTHAR